MFSRLIDTDHVTGTRKIRNCCWREYNFRHTPLCVL